MPSVIFRLPPGGATSSGIAAARRHRQRNVCELTVRTLALADAPRATCSDDAPPSLCVGARCRKDPGLVTGTSGEVAQGRWSDREKREVPFAASLTRLVSLPTCYRLSELVGASAQREDHNFPARRQP